MFNKFNMFDKIKRMVEEEKTAEEKTITITKEQFLKAVSMAADEWNSDFTRLGANSKTTGMMCLQNIMFGAEIARILFGENKEEK